MIIRCPSPRECCERPCRAACAAAALELKPHAEGLEASVAALLRSASGRGATRGTVRITASEVVGAEVLPPILASLRERHPEIVIELVLNNHNEDLLSREADIAVRMNRPTQQAQLAAIRAGLGVGICQVGLAKRDPEMVRVLPKALSLKLETWIVMHSDLRGSARCRVVSDALAEGIGAYIASAGG